MLKKIVLAVMMVGSFVSAPPGPWNLSPDAHREKAVVHLGLVQEIQKSLDARSPAARRARGAHEAAASKRNLIAIHRTHARLHTELAGLSSIQNKEKRVRANRGIQSLFGRLGRQHGMGALLTKDVNEKAWHNAAKSAANEVAAGSTSSTVSRMSVRDVPHVQARAFEPGGTGPRQNASRAGHGTVRTARPFR